MQNTELFLLILESIITLFIIFQQFYYKGSTLSTYDTQGIEAKLLRCPNRNFSKLTIFSILFQYKLFLISLLPIHFSILLFYFAPIESIKSFGFFAWYCFLFFNWLNFYFIYKYYTATKKLYKYGVLTKATIVSIEKRGIGRLSSYHINFSYSVNNETVLSTVEGFYWFEKQIDEPVKYILYDPENITNILDLDSFEVSFELDKNNCWQIKDKNQFLEIFLPRLFLIFFIFCFYPYSLAIIFVAFQLQGYLYHYRRISTFKDLNLIKYLKTTKPSFFF
ncbi:MAG: hypothetical protein COB02_07150 [Candidatus Cloacimonadota bacterium]|nr:MAG: hypothetical protein COB02_07150 [Candidatus Cloacimonadota bacterium]